MSKDAEVFDFLDKRYGTRWFSRPDAAHALAYEWGLEWYEALNLVRRVTTRFTNPDGERVYEWTTVSMFFRRADALTLEERQRLDRHNDGVERGIRRRSNHLKALVAEASGEPVEALLTERERRLAELAA